MKEEEAHFQNPNSSSYSLLLDMMPWEPIGFPLFLRILDKQNAGIFHHTK